MALVNVWTESSSGEYVKLKTGDDFRWNNDNVWSPTVSADGTTATIDAGGSQYTFTVTTGIPSEVGGVGYFKRNDIMGAFAAKTGLTWFDYKQLSNKSDGGRLYVLSVVEEPDTGTLTFNGNTPSAVVFNGAQVSKAVCNGVEIWSAAV